MADIIEMNAYEARGAGRGPSQGAASQDGVTHMLWTYAMQQGAPALRIARGERRAPGPAYRAVAASATHG